MRHSLGRVVATATVAAAVPHAVIVGLLDRHAVEPNGALFDHAVFRVKNPRNGLQHRRFTSAIGA